MKMQLAANFILREWLNYFVLLVLCLYMQSGEYMDILLSGEVWYSE